MKRFLLAGIAAAFCGLPALAADMPVKAPMAAQVFNWTGSYIGADAGGFWGHTSITINNLGPLGEARMKPDGFLYGARAGYRWQDPSRYVWGWEADIWGISGRTDERANTDTPLGDKFRATAGGSLRLQAGYAVDRLLYYVTGGLSVIHIKGCQTIPSPGPCEPGDSFSDDKLGFTVGGGMDYAFAPNWTARIEYLFSDYGSHNYHAETLIPPSVLRMHDFTTNVVRIGLTYKFGGDPWGKGPVVAKY
jgi:outer membrane immunogenic protein